MENDNNSKIEDSNEGPGKNENLKNAICYIPLVAFMLFFTESNKTPELMKHIKYGGSLFVIYIILNVFI